MKIYIFIFFFFFGWLTAFQGVYKILYLYEKVGLANILFYYFGSLKFKIVIPPFSISFLSFQPKKGEEFNKATHVESNTQSQLN